MNEETKLPFDLDEIVRSLPPRRESIDFASQNQEYIDMCVNDFMQMIGKRRSLSGQLADLTVSLTRTLKDAFGNVAKWADTLVPDFDVVPLPNCAYATRSVGAGSVDEEPTKLSFEKMGDGCLLKIEVEVASDGANLKARLLDDEGNAMLPFFVTVRPSRLMTNGPDSSILMPSEFIEFMMTLR